MAYGPPPSPGQGQQPGQPGWQQQGQQAWQQPQPSAWQQQQPPAQQGRSTAQMPGHFGQVSHDEKSWALMAYVGQFLIGAIAPAIAFVGKGRSPFVRRHAAQGLNMGLAAIAVWLVGGLLSLAVEVMIWIPLGFTAVTMFYLVYGARAANRGEFRRVPTPVAWPIFK
ncbi:DUF4870 domain-containing protein [Actinomadura rudentiformis]|uniref:DUF4870 domain-containing protein n=1 Tax=Actinomadura rudentiformis TaxID=359158 RepID=A0A6H9YPT7_9ACTN|nr:DUF4870 domain-containing protein [Actinomadura rudentiformis]KAB2345610.1 DUF4870 domain-containing protein [Actinomadura rudentiformis]